jgi:protein-S-isoprenylcysteine O-methyltransferase Ste14
MSLRNELEQTGFWLFRHRSYLPLVIVPIFVVSLCSFSYLGQSHLLNELWQIACLAISFLGLAVRILTVGRAPLGTSGRNTLQQEANCLNSTGMYSIVRHPLYLGNYLIILGIALWPHIWWLPVLTSCFYALYYERIMLAEEAFLRERFGEAFEKWSAQTPTFIPRLRGWKPSPVPFCWRTVAQREYNAFFLIISVFFLFDFIGDSIANKNNWQMDAEKEAWFGVFIAGFVVFAVLRTLKKRTRLLHVEGR